MSDSESISTEKADPAASPTAEGQSGGIGEKLRSLVPSSVWSIISPSARIALAEEREAYIHEVRHEIMGWNGTGALRLVHEIGKQQIALGVRGGIAEIGVHHGQLLVFLMMLMRNDEHAVAIDLFEDQHLNIDNSGKGDREILMGNIARYCARSQERLSVLACDSTKLKSEDILQATKKPVRLFSVDGGHTREVVLSDLLLSTASLHDAGVVILDDVFNMYFPGVGEGLADYLNGPARGGQRL